MRNAVYITLAGCLWGMIALFINILNAMGFASLQCVALRAFFTAVLLFFYLLATDRRKLKIALRDLPFFLGTGLCSIVFFNFCYFEAIRVSGSAAVPALLMYTAPIFVMLLSAALFHEKITRVKLAAIALTFLGLGLVTGAFSSGEGLSLRVLLLGLGAGLGYALYSIFGKFVVDKYDPATITFYTFAVAAIGVAPLSGIGAALPQLRPASLLPALGLALFSTVLPFLLYTRGLRGMDAGAASLLASVEPVVAAAVGALFFHETFTAEKLAGMLCVLFAISLPGLASLCSAKRQKQRSL